MAYRDFTEVVEVAAIIAGVNGVVTLAADPKTQYVIRGVILTYTTAPTGSGKVTIAFTNMAGQARTITIDVAAAVGKSDQVLGIQCALNTAVTITGFSNTAGVGNLTVLANSIKVSF